MRRLKFGIPTHVKRPPLEVLKDPNLMSWPDYDDLSEDLKRLIQVYGELDVKNTARFISSDDPNVLETAIIKTKALRLKRQLK